MRASTNIFQPRAICPADGCALADTADIPWLCALLLRWPSRAVLVKFELPRKENRPRHYGCAFRSPEGTHFLPMLPDTPFPAVIPADGTQSLRRGTVARYLINGFFLRGAIPRRFRKTLGSLTLVTDEGPNGFSSDECLVNDGRITAAGKRLRAEVDPPLNQSISTADKIIPLLVLPDSDPATWKDGSRFCPIHGRVQPITLIHASPAITWSNLCGRAYTRHVCPRCLYCFHSELSLMN